MPRRRLWVRCALWLGLPSLLVVAPWLWVRSLERRATAAMERRVAEVAAEIRGRETRRPTILDDPLPGNAWDDYLAAVSAFDAMVVPAIPIRNDILYQYFEGHPKADATRAKAIVTALGAALDRLLVGARRSELRPPDWTGGDLAHPHPGVMTNQIPGLASGCAARLLIEEGRSKDGVRLLLASAQFGRDLAAQGDFGHENVGFAIIWWSLEELKRQIQAGRLHPEELDRLHPALETLDRTFPLHADSLKIEYAILGNSILRGTFWGNLKNTFFGKENWEAIRPGWRRAFSKRILEARWMMELGEATALETLPYSEERQWITERTRSADAFPGLDFYASSRWNRERLAQLRLLRTAIRYRATGDVLALDDPLGTTLRTRQSGNTLRIWSAGRDGTDDGGSGEWHPVRGKDIVLEVTR